MKGSERRGFFESIMIVFVWTISVMNISATWYYCVLTLFTVAYVGYPLVCDTEKNEKDD